jgi:hypothetical protein
MENQYQVDFKYIIDKLIEQQEKNLENDRKVKEHLLNIRIKLDENNKDHSLIKEDIKGLTNLVANVHSNTDQNILKAITENQTNIVKEIGEIKDTYKIIKNVMLAIAISFPVLIAIAEFIASLIKDM